VRFAPMEPIKYGHLIQVRILARQQRGTAGGANRIRDKCIRKTDSIFGDSVDVRRLIHSRAVAGDRMLRVVIGKDEDDVRTFGL
jgi:hypothetical protein